FSGTPVYDVSTVQNWTDPSYNIFGDVTFDEDADIGDGDTDVELFIFSEEPVNILANVNMNRVTFRPPAGSQFWGGLHYGGGSQGSLHEINLIGALRPLRINGSNPQVFNLSITPADPDELIDDIGLEIEGDASPNLIDVEITNYRTGILVNGTGRNRATTPTLTNTRIRNSTQGSRNGHETTTGIRVTGDVNIHLNDVEIKDYSLGLSIENDESAYTTTPNLINTRILHSIEDDEIRNESDAIGLRISGNVAVSMTDVEISDVNVGIVMENGANSNRSTPTLTNTRIRNSTQGSRSGDAIGVSLSNIPSILMDDCEIDGFGNGMIIVGDDFRATSTPTLTNTRIRNSTQGSRSTSTGLSISGDVLLTMENCDIDDYDQGIRYIGDGSSPRAVSTPTLTNTRVRNSNQGSRSTSTGISLTDIPQIYIGGGLVEGYHTGIEISGGDVRAVSTPTLTNTRVRNSTQGSRTENVGIFLGTGVLGRVDYCTVEEARIGILIADGNGTILRRNKLKNCEIGIRGSGILPVLPIHQHVFILTDDYFMEHPTLNYRALDLYFPGPWVVSNNTISGYSKAITANNAVIAFVNNILWSSYNTQIPFELNNSMMEQNNNDIRYDGGIYPGSGNINADPMFIDPAIENFNLHYNSPCIDAGSLLTPRDADGTVSDIGAFAYLHQAEFKASTRFVTVGTTVDFFNQSIGHDHPVSITEWDLNNDQTIDSFNRNWSHQFNEPGWYDVRLRMSTGPLVDDVVYERYVVVQVYQLKPPTNLNVGINESIFQLEWDAVTHTTNDLPITVNYYLIYSSDDPEGVFRFRTFTEAPVTSYSEALSPSFQRRFYFVIGFSGSRRMLMDFIDRSPEIDLHDLNIAIPINDTVERRP
ncbi:MAG: hypothetical protein FJ042_07540, partial [Candidatus Cloacimonetes bacterium]|nr:hypothetical protein [Candidatus Cloacimonadota bacterium]